MTVRLLIADTSPHVRSLLRWLFEQDGRFSVQAETANGHDVIGRAGDVDVIVTEIELEVLDGLTALTEVHDAYPQVAVVVHSALTQPFFRGEAAARGAAGFIAKGAEPDEIVAAVIAAAGGVVD